MAKEFSPVEIDFEQARLDLAAFRNLLDQFRGGVLKERQHVLAFFRGRPNLAALLGYTDKAIGQVDRLAYEFDFFGDYAADLALGDSKRGEYFFVEFENATASSIFKKSGRKVSLDWSERFDHGYSQIIDWFWKLSDLAQTSTGRARFGRTRFNYHALLVIGRSDDLADLERERFEWRRTRVVVDSKVIHCLTFDDLYDNLAFQLERYAPATLIDSMPNLRPRLVPSRSLPRKFGRKRGH